MRAGGGRGLRLALAALLALGLSTPAARAASVCAAPAAVWGGFPQLARAQRKLRVEHRLTIVAVGSSSTQGVGASGPAKTYPAQLQKLLEARFPGAAIAVLNRGIGGETVAANLARFARDVLAAQPDLVIWQVGTNDALTGVAATTLRSQLLDGIARVRDVGADLVLMDPQPLPQAQREAAVEAVQAVLASTARAAKVPLLPRHELMSYWLASGQIGAATLLGADGLHMTDASYRCLAERVADLLPAPAASTVRADAT